MDEPPLIGHAEAARITEAHDQARRESLKDIAQRNRRAQEEAKRGRDAEEKFRKQLKADLYW